MKHGVVGLCICDLQCRCADFQRKSGLIRGDSKKHFHRKFSRFHAQNLRCYPSPEVMTTPDTTTMTSTNLSRSRPDKYDICTEVGGENFRLWKIKWDAHVHLEKLSALDAETQYFELIMCLSDDSIKTIT